MDFTQCTNTCGMQSYRSSFAISKSLLALFLSWQGFNFIDFEWTFLHLKSIIDQITQYTFKNAKFEAFIAAMHWHRSKSTFLLEQFLNSEKSNQEQMWGWGHLLWSCLLLSHNRSPPSGSFRSWVWLDFKKNLKQYFYFWKEGSSPCQRQSTGLNILWTLGQGVQQFWKLVENTMSTLYLIFVISVAQANPKFYTPKNIKKAPQKNKKCSWGDKT